MKSLGYIVIFFASAAGMFISLSRRQQNSDLNSTAAVASSVTDDRTWDQKNRRPVDSVFFIKTPAWMGGSKDEDTSDPARTSSQPVSSGVQSNPFSP